MSDTFTTRDGFVSTFDLEGENEDKEDVPVCNICGGTPCEWDDYGKQCLITMGERFTADPHKEGQYVCNRDDACYTSGAVRKLIYKMFTYQKHGHLGKGNRIPIPSCVVKKIRKSYPDPLEVYIGFHAEAQESDVTNHHTFTI